MGITAIDRVVSVVETTTDKVVTATERTVQVVAPINAIINTGSVASSASNVKTWEAGENISSGRLLEVRSGKVYYHDPNGTKEPYGIAGNAAVMGDDVEVTLNGDVTISGWGLTAETTYFSKDNGQIGTTPNATTRAQVIGYAIKTDTLNVKIQQPINY